MEYESDGDTNYNWLTRYSHQRIDARTEGLGKKRTNGDHPDYSIVKIGQKIKKTPRDWRRLAVTLTPVQKTSANGGVKNTQNSFENNQKRMVNHKLAQKMHEKLWLGGKGDPQGIVQEI